MKKHTQKMYANFCLLFIATVAFTGCVGRTKAPYVVERYTLDYVSPVISGLTPMSEFIRIERFSVAQFFNGAAMVYKPSLYRFDSYPYSRWAVNPGDLVSDFLLRDLRKCGLFKGVLSYDASEPARFVLEGSIEDFFESDEGPSSRAVFTVNVLMLDDKKKEPAQKLFFQKTYRLEIPLAERSPGELARGLSSAMALFSEQLVKDLNSALTTQ